MEQSPSPSPAVHKGQIFWLSVLALATTGVGFSLRGNISSDLQTSLFDAIDKAHSAAMVGNALGLVFLGFAMSIAIGSPLLDYIGMKQLLMLSSFCYLAGTSTVVFSRQLPAFLSVYQIVCIGMFITGMGQGLVETVINPLTATLYPDDKTSRLNTLHAWWPGGIIIGGLIGLVLSNQHVGWAAQLSIVIVPAALYGFATMTQKFPPTERVAAGVPASEMWAQIFNPLFIILFLCMFLTAASELAPGQWIDFALSRTVGMKGIFLLVYVSGLMFVMRHFAGPMAHKLSPVGLLWVSCLMASLGLLGLSYANSQVTGLLAATVWGVGVCYMWPTMLGSASERFPKGGALVIGLMGTAGTLSIYFVLPLMGKIYDYAKIKEAGGEEAFNKLSGPELETVLAHAGQFSFRVVAILPAFLLLVFGAIWLHDKSKGGYKPAKIQ